MKKLRGKVRGFIGEESAIGDGRPQKAITTQL